MNISDLLRSVRVRINDTDVIGFQEDELLDYINMGIQWIHRTINRERPELIATKETIQSEPYRLTKKAIRILEGPADLIFRLDGSLDTEARAPFVVRYVPDMDQLKNTDTFPYFNSFANFVIEMAVIRAQARNEFDMSQEAEFLNRMEAQLLETIWGIQSERIDVDPYFPIRHYSGDYGGVD